MDQGKEVGLKSSFSLRAIKPADKTHGFSVESPNCLADETQNPHDEAEAVCLTKHNACMTKPAVVCLTKYKNCLTIEVHSFPDPVTCPNNSNPVSP